MRFFRQTVLEEVPELLRDGLCNPIPGTMDNGPAFVISGHYDHLVPLNLLDEVYHRSLEMGDGLKPSENLLFQESLLKIKENTVKASIQEGLKLLGLRSSFYAKTDLGADEMSSYPFHASEGSQSFIREVDALAWDSIGASRGRHLKWLASYLPAHDPDLYTQMDRSERFLYEDLYEYLEKNGTVALFQHVSGEKELDTEEEKYAEAKTCGVRDGFYEIKSLYECVEETRSSAVDGLKLIMRKEAYLVIPFKKLVFEFAPEADRAYNSTSFRVFPLNDSQLYVFFLSHTPFPPKKKTEKEDGSGKKGRSLFSKLFKKQ